MQCVCSTLTHYCIKFELAIYNAGAPEKIIRLALFLGLGSTGHNTESTYYYYTNTTSRVTRTSGGQTPGTPICPTLGMTHCHSPCFPVFDKS